MSARLATSLIVFFSIMLTACTSTSPLPAPAELSLPGGGQMIPAPGWALIPDALDGRRTRGQRLTRYGVDLDQVWLATGLKPGQRLVEASADTQDGPAWGEGENPDDVGAFLADSLAAIGYHGCTLEGGPLTEPQADWGPATDFTAHTGRGLAYRGQVRIRLRGGRLDLVLWMAEADIYAGRVEDGAKSMLTSLN